MLLPAVLLLAGCFAIEVGYVVEEDGSGSQTIRFAVPAEVLGGFGEGLPDVQELEADADVAAVREALDGVGTMTFFSNPQDGVGFEVTVLVDASDDFAAAIAARGEELAARIGDDADFSMLELAGDDLVLRRDGDEWVFELRLESLDMDALGALTGDPDAAGMASFFLDQTTVTTTLRLPGELGEHNADEVREDGTLVWVQSGADSARTYTARSSVGTAGVLTMMQAGLLIGGIAIIAGVSGYLLFGRRRQPA
jgi:hypothetical protein